LSEIWKKEEPSYILRGPAQNAPENAIPTGRTGNMDIATAVTD
jgi:hypothetical protein